ncbi:MAG: hypothetical protein CME88_04415 [Hirschia sp.]|nr:hypothetical protein [Hirschia sp.]MBF17604.1 hypothetical protein [Hirschia sp.]|tara:strand:+ start:216 stop:632 length:417 start_codon:yes stop_codon:yes gene_type:complete
MLNRLHPSLSISLLVRNALLCISGVAILMACQTGEVDNMADTPLQPAVIASADADTLAALKTALSGALGRANITFGAGDLTANPTITILPPPPNPNETHSVAMPTMFDLYLGEDGACYAIQRGKQDKITLDGVACRPA